MGPRRGEGRTRAPVVFALSLAEPLPPGDTVAPSRLPLDSAGAIAYPGDIARDPVTTGGAMSPEATTGPRASGAPRRRPRGVVPALVWLLGAFVTPAGAADRPLALHPD